MLHESVDKRGPEECREDICATIIVLMGVEFVCYRSPFFYEPESICLSTSLPINNLFFFFGVYKYHSRQKLKRKMVRLGTISETCSQRRRNFTPVIKDGTDGWRVSELEHSLSVILFVVSRHSTMTVYRVASYGNERVE